VAAALEAEFLPLDPEPLSSSTGSHTDLGTAGEGGGRMGLEG
jgi:hypothetical protein